MEHMATTPAFLPGEDPRTEEPGGLWYIGLQRIGHSKAPGVGDGQGSLACCGPWGREELDMTAELN